MVDRPLPSSRCLAITYTVLGGLLVAAAGSRADALDRLATNGGLARSDRVQFQVFTQSDHPALPSNRLSALEEDERGDLWIGSEHSGLARLRDGRIQRFEPPEGVMIDVDCFKSYNDLHGHPVGDDCLRQVAALLASGLRRADETLARYGGEELAAVVPETSQEDLRERAKEAGRDRVETVDLGGAQEDDLI